MGDLLKGKRAVITGCNRGIGKSILENFAANGADIITITRTESEEFSEICHGLEKTYGVHIRQVYADFDREDEVRAAAKSILEEKKTIDILVNNVGISNPLVMFTMTSMEKMREMFEVSFFSSILLTQLLCRRMMKAHSGNIIFITSSAAFEAGFNLEYTSAKAAVVGAVRRLARELGHFGIRVNGVAPGLTNTDMGNALKENEEAIALSMSILGRKAEPEEIADVVLFLASDLSRFMTAQILRVDGGMLG